MKPTIKDFIAKYGDLNLLEGNHYKGSIYLQGTQITALPEGLTVGGSLDLQGTQITALPEGLTVGGYLDLQGTQITALPEGLTVGGYLDLQGTQITALPEGLTVGGSLDLQGTQITALPEGLTVGDTLYLQGTQITALPEGLTVGGSLYLQGTQITSLPEGLTVGGSLDLQGTQITALPEGLTVGGYLDLQGTQITALPEGLTVGGYLDLRGTQITDTSKVNRNIPEPLMWEWRGRRYIKADGIFQQVIKQRGNVYVVRSIGSCEDQYLVTDGNGKWAHGDTVKAAKDDLIYKISNRDKSKYEGWTMQTEVSFEEAIEAYRVITGACAAGTKGFVEHMTPGQRKDRYTVDEIIELTKGQYGHEAFKAFFGK